MIPLAGCGAKPQVITQIKTIYVRVPGDLTTLSELKRPAPAKTVKDIIEAYVELFYHYEECRIKIERVRELGEKAAPATHK